MRAKKLIVVALGITVLTLTFWGLRRTSIGALNRAIANDDLEAIRASAAPLKSSSILYGKNPLEVAIESENKEAFSLLLERGADPHSKDESGLPIIHLCCTLEDPFWLNRVLQYEADPNLMWPGNWTERPRRPMCVAMRTEQFHLVPILVDAGASLSEPIMEDPHADYSPLGYASGQGPEAVETVLYLLEKGATPDLTKRPSSVGAFKQDSDVVEWRRPITKWFEDHGMDLRNAKWDGKQWVIPPFP